MDETLSFLDHFVEEAIRRGASRYAPPAEQDEDGEWSIFILLFIINFCGAQGPDVLYEGHYHSGWLSGSREGGSTMMMMVVVLIWPCVFVSCDETDYESEVKGQGPALKLTPYAK